MEAAACRTREPQGPWCRRLAAVGDRESVPVAAPHVWLIVAGSLGALFAAVILSSFLVRRFFQSTRDAHKEQIVTAPRTENPSAFMAASMQGVIQKLRDQEKELERLHRLEKERAEQTERLSEEATRNRPTGRLWGT